MEKLLEIAADYGKVKNQVYQRYGGIGNLEKLYPGYTVQNEMTESGLRKQMNLPSVYFYLAIFDALGDIKAHWTQVREKTWKAVQKNVQFTDEDRNYLRFVLKVSNCFTAALTNTTPDLPAGLEQRYQQLQAPVDSNRLEHYLKRQVRKHLRKLHTDAADGFSVSGKAYRYDHHGIYLATKEARKRVFVPLTDSNRYSRQLFVKLFAGESRLEIIVPLHVRIRQHADYQHEVGLSPGMLVMLTTDRGTLYGEKLGELMAQDAEWIRTRTKRYRENRENNPGRKKYEKQKQRRDERLHSYINAELNRFFREEKPKVLYIPRLPDQNKAGRVRKYNFYATMWQRGYIRRRLTQKCLEQSVRIVEVMGRGISSECSRCGSCGVKEKGLFHCPVCGYRQSSGTNAACNAKARGQKLLQQSEPGPEKPQGKEPERTGPEGTARQTGSPEKKTSEESFHE